MDDIDAFIDNISHLLKAFPKETESFMKAEAREMRKQVVRLAKSRVRKVTGNYFKGFKAGKKVYKWSDADYNVRVYNSAPHAHLIENGYRGLAWGHPKGWTPGKHIMADGQKQYEPQFAKHVENDLVDFIVKELEK